MEDKLLFQLSDVDNTRIAKDIFYTLGGILAHFEVPTAALESARLTMGGVEEGDIVLTELPEELVVHKLKLNAMNTAFFRKIEDLGGLDKIIPKDVARMILVDQFKYQRDTLHAMFWTGARLMFPIPAGLVKKPTDFGGYGIRKQEDGKIILVLTPLSLGGNLPDSLKSLLGGGQDE